MSCVAQASNEGGIFFFAQPTKFLLMFYIMNREDCMLLVVISRAVVRFVGEGKKGVIKGADIEMVSSVMAIVIETVEHCFKNLITSCVG